MDFFELCASRYSLRRFAQRPVEKEKIVKCLEAARLAPTAGNAQPCRFAVFDDAAKKQQLCDAVFTGIYSVSRFFAAAPVIVALLVKSSLVYGRLGSAITGKQWQLVDAGIGGEHFVLQAQELGLGTCWIGWFDGKRLLEFLGLRGRTLLGVVSPGYVPVALLAVGYPPAGKQTPIKQRKDLSEIAGWNDMPER